MKRLLPVFSLVLILFSGCRPDMVLLEKADRERGPVARTYIDHLRAGRISEIVTDLAPELRKGGDVEPTFHKMRELIPQEEPGERVLVGFRWWSPVGQPTQYALTYQYAFAADRWVMINLSYRELGTGKFEVLGMHVTPLAASLQELNRFTLAGKSAWHHLFLVACATTVLLILITLVVCVRTPVRRRKWLWIVFVLLGFGQFTLNWTTGEWGWQAMSINLLGAGITSTGTYAPWMVTFALPVGAIVFWIRRRHLILAARPTPPMEIPPLPPA
jgi:hypothetical protein